MTRLEAIQARHSVRSYTDKALSKEVITALHEEINQCNQEGHLHFQLITQNEAAFKSLIPAFGRFKNVKNYIALVAKDTESNYESCGYYGARIMIFAQQLGLNSCWVAGSYNKKKCPAILNLDEKLISVIAIGYGSTNGVSHKSKKMESLCQTCNSEWFKNGMNAAILAPTGYNKQDFFIESAGNTVSARTTNDKPMGKIDLGIVKYHFEIGAGRQNFTWNPQ